MHPFLTAIPEVPCAALAWPFHYRARSADTTSPRCPTRALVELTDPGVEERFRTAIAMAQGPARHEGFQLSVLGRLPPRVADLVFRIIMACLALRMLPEAAAWLSRILLPKDTPGDTRPITLAMDLCAYLNGEVQRYFGGAVERTPDLLPESVVAYRRGMGCVDLLTRDLAAIEDAGESGQFLARFFDDWAKFFDRVSTVFQLLALRLMGCPPGGYVEWKAEDMYRRFAKVVTRQGILELLHECGYQQGNPFSCGAVNSVCRLLHILWDATSPLRRTEPLRKVCLQCIDVERELSPVAGAFDALVDTTVATLCEEICMSV